MIFWVWAKHLEDKFDGKTRMNLRHLIGQIRRPSTTTEDGKIYYYLRNSVGHVGEKDSDDESLESNKRKELPRIDSCAVFHKITSGRGVPHTFSGEFSMKNDACRRRSFLYRIHKTVAISSSCHRWSIHRLAQIHFFDFYLLLRSFYRSLLFPDLEFPPMRDMLSLKSGPLRVRPLFVLYFHLWPMEKTRLLWRYLLYWIPR